MNLRRDNFVSDQHWREHKLILGIPGARCYGMDEIHGGILVRYAINLCDHKFLLIYDNDGGSSFYYLHGSLNNVRTLKDLLRPKVVI